MRNWQAQPRGGARIGKRANYFLPPFPSLRPMPQDMGVQHQGVSKRAGFTNPGGPSTLQSLGLTLINPSPFPLNCDIINIHEHNLHDYRICIFVCSKIKLELSSLQ